MSKRNVKRRTAQRRTKKQLGWRPLVFGAIVLLVLGAAVWFLKPALWPTDLTVAQADAGENVILVQADMAGIYPKTIRVKVGEPVTVRLKSLDNQFHSDGGGKHGFAIDELDVDIVAPPLGVAEATFTPTQVGEYEYYCDICCGGRANPTMVGKLIVEL
jgi:heme/copper-type cytochrome/quinol oxidase subunit 2